MMPREGIQQRLNQLKEVTDNTAHLKAEIKELIRSATIDNIEAEVLLEKNYAFSLYTLRYEILLEKGKTNQNWAALLVKLGQAHDDVQVTISVLNLGSKAYIIFTDKEYSECFGIIYVDQAEE